VRGSRQGLRRAAGRRLNLRTEGFTEGDTMSKGQRGNKEAKKPKKVPAPNTPATPGDPAALGASTLQRPKR
jgi:hypothetical protein